MSQIYCMSDQGSSEAEKRVKGMKMLGQQIRAQLKAPKPVEPAMTQAIIDIIDLAGFDMYFTDPGGHTGPMREAPKKKSELQYENKDGDWKKVKIKYNEDKESGGTQVMHIGAGKLADILNEGYLKGLAEEADNLVKDGTWDVNDPVSHNYFLATVNLRRCR